MDYLKKRYNLIDFLMLISIVFIGSDIWGVEVAGFNIRFIQLYYVFVFVYMAAKNKLRIVYPKPVCVFLLFYALSFLFSVNIVNSFLYFVFVVYNVFILGVIFYSYVYYCGKEKFIAVFRFSLLIITVCIVISAALGNIFGVYIPFFSYQTYQGIVRTALWFYEPSYLATFLILYLGFAVYNLFVVGDKRYVCDMVMAVVSLALTTSTTGFVGIAIGLFFAFILKLITIEFAKDKLLYLLKCVLFVAMIILLVAVFLPNVYDVFIMRLFNENLSASTGGRVNTYAEDFNLFLKYPLFGVGPNNYGYYLYGDSDLQPTNVTLELLTTTGVFATAAFYAFLLAPLFSSKANRASKAGMFAMLLFLIILQVNQGYMRLYLWMWAYVNYAFVCYRPEEKLGLQCEEKRSCMACALLEQTGHIANQCDKQFNKD